MVQLKCPSCNANIELDGAREFGFCCYCGTKVIFKDNNKKIDGIAGVESELSSLWIIIKFPELKSIIIKF